MKKALRYPELWQKKRSELPVSGNPDTDWLQMRSVLDKQMPVSGAIKKPFRFKGSKWWFNSFIAVSSVVLMYGGVHLYLSKHTGGPSKNSPQVTRHDSVALQTRDSLSPVTTKDSITLPAVGNNALPAKPVIAPTKDSVSEKRVVDSIGTLDISSSGLHRDSTAIPATINSVKPVRDSALLHENRIIQQDTSKSKGPKKKRKPRVNVFF
jgi:hypothetical protein